MDELRRKGLEKMNEVYAWEMPNVEGDLFFDLDRDHSSAPSGLGRVFPCATSGS